MGYDPVIWPPLIVAAPALMHALLRAGRCMLMLQEHGCTKTESAKITGYARTYVTVLVRTLTAEPAQRTTAARESRPVGV